MASSPADLAQATQVFADEEATLEQIISQAVSGDLNARTVLLPAEIQTALTLKSTMLASVPDADTSGIDSIIANAQTIAGGAATPAVPGMLSKSGLKLGPIVIPWVGVAAIALFVGGAFYFSKPRRH